MPLPPPEILITKFWPIDIVGLVWLKLIALVLLAPILALIIPQALKSEEQIVMAAKPLVALAVKFTVVPLTLAEIILELELLVNK